MNWLAGKTKAARWAVGKDPAMPEHEHDECYTATR